MQVEPLVKTAQHAPTPAERRAAFEVLAAEFSAQAERWAYQVLGDPAAAQDAAQEALITAFEHLGALRDPAAFPGWLKRIVSRQCSRITRARDYDAPALEDETLAEDDDDPAAIAEARELARRLRGALDRLPEGERRVTELFYLSDLSQQEIAERMALPLTTVKKRLQYAREHLRETLAGLSMSMGVMRMAGVMDSADDVIRWLLLIPVGSIEPMVLV